jgi:hypothetical protein
MAYGKDKWSDLAGGLRADYANNLDIVDSNFEGNGYGIKLGGGASVRVVGNDMEATAGPGVMAAAVSGLTISNNYFEGNNNKNMGGPLVLRPDLEHNQPGASAGRNLTVWANIVLNGVPAGGDIDRYGNAYPVNNAVISGNYHSTGTTKKGNQSGVPGSAVLLIAAVGVSIEGAVCGMPLYGPGAQPTRCPAGPLVVTGVDDRLFRVQDVSIRKNTGWGGRQGWVHLLPLADAAFHARGALHTWDADGCSSHNFARPIDMGSDRQGLALPGQGLPPPAVATLPRMRNGSPQYELSDANIGPATLAGVASIDLASWPAVAGRAVYYAVEAMVVTNRTGLSLAIDAGGGAGWTYSHQTIASAAQVGAFSITSFQAIMPAVPNGTARFAVKMWGEGPAAGGASKAVVAAVAVGVVGAGLAMGVAVI